MDIAKTTWKATKKPKASTRYGKECEIEAKDDICLRKARDDKLFLKSSKRWKKRLIKVEKDFWVKAFQIRASVRFYIFEDLWKARRHFTSSYKTSTFII